MYGLWLMGAMPRLNCGGYKNEAVYVSVNPNPKNFKILRMIELANTFVEVFYPDVRNYEGHKILVYYGQVAHDIMNAKELDPHFTNENRLSPIARFKPDALGEWFAMQITKGLSNE